MIREEFKRKLERRRTKVVVIWLAFFLFDFYYVWAAHYLAAHHPVVIAPAFASKLRKGRIAESLARSFSRPEVDYDHRHRA